MTIERSRLLLAALVPVSLLSHLGAVVPARSYFFRDFGMSFLPLKRYLAEEIALGRWPWWNPYIQSGAPVFPMLYPVDLLHVLWRSPEAVSWLVTLHYPLAAIAAYALGRELGLGRAGAFACGSVYSLGGLAVASLNLYAFLQALAWAPLVVATLLRAAARGGRWIPAAALTLAVAVPTAQEFVAQAVVIGLALALVPEDAPRPLAGARPAARLALALAVALLLSAVTVAVAGGVLPETVRGRGFERARLFDYELHPAGLFQLLVRDFFGSVVEPLDLWWGHRFFTKGFPYFVTLYLGPQALALAAAGLGALPRRRRGVLAALGLLGLLYALGRSGGLAPLLAALPGLDVVRFPSKALLTVHVVLAVLAGAGVERLRRGEGWSVYRVTVAALGLVALAVALLAHFSVDVVADWMWSDPAGNPLLRAALRADAFVSAAVAGLGVLAAVAAATRRIDPSRAALLVAGVAVLDLARAGAGVNRQATPALHRLLPELAAERLDALEGGRVFTYGTEFSPRFREWVRSRAPGGLLWAYFVRRQMLVPLVNVGDRVETAFSDDEGFSLLVRPDVAGPRGYDPARFELILPALRNAAVTRVLSLDPLAHGDLRLRRRVPAGPPGLLIHVYELASSWPRSHVACRVVAAGSWTESLAAPSRAGFDGARDVALEGPGPAACRSGRARRVEAGPGRDRFEVELDGPGYLVTRDSHARGWTATVDGRAAPVLRANGRHRAVLLGAGRHDVRFRYDPPGLRAGLWAMGAGLLAGLALWMRPVLR